MEPRSEGESEAGDAVGAAVGDAAEAGVGDAAGAAVGEAAGAAVRLAEGERGSEVGDGGAVPGVHDALRPLAPRAVTLWRIGGALSLLLYVPLTMGVVFAIDALSSEEGVHALRSTALAGALVTPLAILRVLVAPGIRYRRWRWQLRRDQLFLQRGLFTIHRTLIPLVRVQNVDTVQGPIARRFGLWSVVVYTAAQSQGIPYLSQAEADTLRESIAELARRAREQD